MVYTTITWNGITITAQLIKSKVVPGTVKQKVGYHVGDHKVLMRSVKDRILTFNFRVVDTEANLDTAEDNLFSSADAESHALVDGRHDGNYILKLEDLEIVKSSQFKTKLEGTMTLREYNQ